MAQELIYTSAERGLRPGTRGFCTVAYTRGMTAATIRLLEALSAYRAVYADHDLRARLNPVAHCHYRYTVEARSVSVVSRVGASGADHTNRANKLAHHVVLSTRERPRGGPAWLAQQPGVLRDTWTGDPCQIDTPLQIPDGDVPGTFAAAWKAATGDAGWAGVVADAFTRRPKVPVFLVFDPGMDTLALVGEALALVPPDSRWQVTFSTYFSSLPAGTTCCWRCCVPDADALREARRIHQALILDLTRPLGDAGSGPLAVCAREGTPLPAAAGGAAASGAAPFVRMANSQRPTLRMRPSLLERKHRDDS